LKLSIIIPVLNERAGIAATLGQLAPLRERGVEIVVVDGGSDDGTRDLAAANSDRVIVSRRGRASQQNAGARIATGDVLAFLHSDTQLPPHADTLMLNAIGSGSSAWGRFDVSFDSGRPMMRVVAAMMNWRSRWTGVATGDQCIFVRRSAFATAGEFPDLPLMEDVALCKLLRRESAPACLRARVITSARRWETHGVWRTIALMSWLRLSYVLGVSPTRLARWYGYR
jgi:rSAM/selenodomain-associated transferase 2